MPAGRPSQQRSACWGCRDCSGYTRAHLVRRAAARPDGAGIGSNRAGWVDGRSGGAHRWRARGWNRKLTREMRVRGGAARFRGVHRTSTRPTSRLRWLARVPMEWMFISTPSAVRFWRVRWSIWLRMPVSFGWDERSLQRRLVVRFVAELAGDRARDPGRGPPAPPARAREGGWELDTRGFVSLP